MVDAKSARSFLVEAVKHIAGSEFCVLDYLNPDHFAALWLLTASDFGGKSVAILWRKPHATDELEKPAFDQGDVPVDNWISPQHWVAAKGWGHLNQSPGIRRIVILDYEKTKPEAKGYARYWLELRKSIALASGGRIRTFSMAEDGVVALDRFVRELKMSGPISCPALKTELPGWLKTLTKDDITGHSRDHHSVANLVGPILLRQRLLTPKQIEHLDETGGTPFNQSTAKLDALKAVVDEICLRAPDSDKGVEENGTPANELAKDAKPAGDEGVEENGTPANELAKDAKVQEFKLVDDAAEIGKPSYIDVVRKALDLTPVNVLPPQSLRDAVRDCGMAGLLLEGCILLLDLQLWMTESKRIEVMRAIRDLGNEVLRTDKRDEHHEERALLPMILSQVDPSLPIILFSSTRERRVIQPLSKFDNIVADFIKPNLVDVRSDDGGKRQWDTAIRKAVRLHGLRSTWKGVVELSGTLNPPRFAGGLSVRLLRHPGAVRRRIDAVWQDSNNDVVMVGVRNLFRMLQQRRYGDILLRCHQIIEAGYTTEEEKKDRLGAIILDPPPQSTYHRLSTDSGDQVNYALGAMSHVLAQFSRWEAAGNYQKGWLQYSDDSDLNDELDALCSVVIQMTLAFLSGGRQNVMGFDVRREPNSDIGKAINADLRALWDGLGKVGIDPATLSSLEAAERGRSQALSNAIREPEWLPIPVRVI